MGKIARVSLLIILALILILSGCSAGSGSVAEVGKRAPDFQLKNLDGQAVSLSDLRGKPVLINFWATWCYWCGIEMPFLEQIYQEWSNKGLELLAINVGESASRARQYMQINNLSFTALLDTDTRVTQKYNITAYPTTFFVDKDGIIQEKVVGAFQNKESIEQYLSKIIP